MGNGNSKENNNTSEDELKFAEVSQIIDYIATNYILTMNFQSLKKLYEKDYCDKLVVLTSEIIQKKFTPLEITYLSQRVKNNIEVNEVKKDDVIFFNKEQIHDLNIQNPTKKKRMCIAISKFYVTVAHIFAAIMTTINPVYVYKDVTGNIVRTSIYEKENIPQGVKTTIEKFNICQTRIDSLKRGNNEKSDEKVINIHPKICSFNEHKNLTDEPGIMELMELYYDDNYDPNTGRFLGMSEETKKDYNSNLKTFYNTFTGNNVSELPENIKSFKDIKLRDYKENKNCQGSEPMFEKNVRGTKSNKLFAQYAENIKKMVKNANVNQGALLNIINQLFTYSINTQTQEKEIRINPSLNEQNIHQIVLETRAIIMKLYLTCENDYNTGVKIYEAIVEQKILETAQNQINTLTKLSETVSFDNNNNNNHEVKTVL